MAWLFRVKARRFGYLNLNHHELDGFHIINITDRKRLVFDSMRANDKLVSVGRALLAGNTVDQIVQNLDSSRDVVYKLRRILTEYRGIQFEQKRNYAERWAA